MLDDYDLKYETFNDNLLLETYLRRTNLDCQVTPVLCGSSFKNISVQPMMDAIVKYLPNPFELLKNNHSKYFDTALNGMSLFFL